jgi:hypothetical protein
MVLMAIVTTLMQRRCLNGCMVATRGEPAPSAERRLKLRNLNRGFQDSCGSGLHLPFAAAARVVRFRILRIAIAILRWLNKAVPLINAYRARHCALDRRL